MSRRRTYYLLIREISTDEIRVCQIPEGLKIRPQPGYTFSGPFRYSAEAERAWKTRDPKVLIDLYDSTLN